MKVCMLTFDLSSNGGVEKATIALANELCKTYQVVIASCIDADLDTSIFDKEIDSSICYGCLGLRQDRLSKMALSAKKLLPSFIERYGIDILILQGHWVGFLGTVCHLKNTKVIFFDHGAIANQWDDKKALVMRWIASRIANHIVTLTERNRKDYIHTFRVSSHKVSVLTNWINEDAYKSPSYNADSRKIISAGRFTEEKGFDLLVKAFSPVYKEHPDWHLDIYGDGEQRTVIEESIHANHLEEGVTLKGMVSDLNQRYAEYAFYVLPSHREGMPLVLLEAKYNRLPIISFDVVTGPSEIITDGKDGLLVEPESIKGLTLAIKRLIEDRELREKMSKASQDNVTKFSKSAIVHQWIQLIDKISGGMQ